MQDRSGSFTILLIEDNQGDVLLMKKALESTSFQVEVEVCTNGEDAIDMFEAGFRPNLVLTDLNLPGMKGTDIVQYIKTNDALLMIPVLVLSSSSDQRDITASYQRFANGYLAKPLEFDAFNTMVNEVLEFWFGTVRLPARA